MKRPLLGFAPAALIALLLADTGSADMTVSGSMCLPFTAAQAHSRYVSYIQNKEASARSFVCPAQQPYLSSSYAHVAHFHVRDESTTEENTCWLYVYDKKGGFWNGAWDSTSKAFVGNDKLVAALDVPSFPYTLSAGCTIGANSSIFGVTHDYFNRNTAGTIVLEGEATPVPVLQGRVD